MPQTTSKNINPLPSSGSTSTSATDTEMLLQLLRRELLLALESMDGAVFRMKLQWILENAGEFVDLVFMSGLDFEGKTALHIAVANRFEEAVKLLVSTGKVDLLATAGDNGWSALHTAVDLGDAKLTQLLLPTHNTTLTPHRVLSSLKQPTASPYAVTALHMAVRRNSVPCAVMLLHTANTLPNDHSSGWTSSEEELAVDKIQQKHHFHGQAGKGSRKLNKLKDRNGDTPLHWAVKTNNYAMARLLCSYGAHPRHSHNYQGQTPFALAKYVLRNTKMTKLLASFSPTSSTNTSVTDNFEDDNEETRIKEDEAIMPLKPPSPTESTLRRVAKASEVDSSCRKLQQTLIRVEVPTPTPGTATAVTAMPVKKSPSGEASNGGSILGRPYLHREVKSTIPQVACLTVITITMGLMSKDRMWLPFSDRNTVGWGLGFAATGGILMLLSIFCLIVDQIAHYSEQIYYKLLEEGGLPAVQSMPPDFTSGVGELPARTTPPGASAIGAASESKLGGVPSLFLTASLPSVAGSTESGGRHGGGGPAARISSFLGSAKGALLTRYGETRTAIPGMSLRPEIPATSGALASAKLRQNLQCERPTEPVSTAAAAGAQPSSYSKRSLSLSRIGGKQEKPVIVYGTSQGNILKDSAV